MPFHHLGVRLDREPLKMGWLMDGKRSDTDLPRESVSLIPADAYFTGWWNRPADMACLYFTPAALRSAAGEELVSEQFEMQPAVGIRAPALSRLIHALHQDAASDHPFGKMLGDSMFVSLAGMLVRDGRVAVQRTYMCGVGDKRIRRTLEFIHAHLTEPLDVGTIASAAETSPFHLTRSFRSAMGCSLWQYVLRQRVRVAAGLMLDSALTLAEVAAMSGFESYSSFATSFKQVRGLAPARFRAAF